jgi:uncharacterized protein (TIGR03067 family)
MIRNIMEMALAAGKELAPVWTAQSPANEDQDLPKELGSFQGGWLLVYWLYNGKELPAREKPIVLSFFAETFTIRAGEGLIEKGAFEAWEPEQRPKAFVYAPTEVEGKPFTSKYPAIYLLNDDVLVVCVGYAGQRPRAFSAEAESNNELVIYKRIKG